MSPTALLAYLLYMNFGYPAFDYCTDHVFAMKSGTRYAYGNRIFNDETITGADIQKVREYINLPFLWFVDESDICSCQLLESEGLTFKVAHTAMSMDLSLLKDCQYYPDVEIREVPLDTINEWIAVLAQSYAVSFDEQSTFIHHQIRRAASDVMHFYIGYYNGIPAAGSLIIIHDAMVSLHQVGTLAQYRGKGLGFAISHKPLMDARAQGCTQAILLASDMGKPIYEKIGFESYAKYKVYG